MSTPPMETAIQGLRDAYRALGDGHAEAALAMLAEDCVWHESAELPDAGVFRGREAVGDFLHGFLDSWERFDQQVEQAVASGNRIALVIHVRARGRGSGVELDSRYAHVWTLRDGLGIRVDGYRDPDAALQALRARNEPEPPSASATSQKAT